MTPNAPCGMSQNYQQPVQLNYFIANRRLSSQLQPPTTTTAQDLCKKKKTEKDFQSSSRLLRIANQKKAKVIGIDLENMANERKMTWKKVTNNKFTTNSIYRSRAFTSHCGLRAALAIRNPSLCTVTFGEIVLSFHKSHCS